MSLKGCIFIFRFHIASHFIHIYNNLYEDTIQIRNYLFSYKTLNMLAIGGTNKQEAIDLSKITKINQKKSQK